MSPVPDRVSPGTGHEVHRSSKKGCRFSRFSRDVVQPARQIVLRNAVSAGVTTTRTPPPPHSSWVSPGAHLALTSQSFATAVEELKRSSSLR